MLSQLDGCVVKPCDPGRPIPKVLQVRLTPEILQLLLKSDGKDISITFDKAMELSIGTHRHPFSIAAESSVTSIYSCKSMGKRQQVLTCAGSITHKLTMRRELGSSISEKLKSRQAEEAAAKHERSVQSIEANSVKKKTAQKQVSSSAIRSDSPVRHTSPFLQARKSPLLVASSPRMSPVPLQSRLAQTLALSPASERELVARLKVSAEAVIAALQKIAHKTGDSWALNDEQFEHLKIWEWKGYTSIERQTAISRTAEAFDRLGLDQKHSARTKLLHPEKRKVEDRDDTSPLSLNQAKNPSTSAEPSTSVHNSLTKVNLGLGISTVDLTSSPLVESTPTKKIVGKGLLTTGSKKAKSEVRPVVPAKSAAKSTKPDSLQAASVTSKGALEPRVESLHKRSSSSPDLPIGKARIRPDQEIRRTQSPSSRTTKLQASPRTSPINAEIRRSEENTHAEVRPIAVADDDRLSSESLHRATERSKKSQTMEASLASLAPSRSPSVSSGDERKSDRTASMTSTSTERSDRSTISHVSTAATSIDLETSQPTKARSKFLTTSKPQTKPLLSSSSPRPPVSQKLAPDLAHKKSLSVALPATQSPIIPSHASEMVNRKRRRNSSSDSTLSPKPKRLQTIDLQNMAKEYKRLYPEYRSLHAEVASKLGDSHLLTKFMDMHNQMSLWKRTLYAEEKNYTSEEGGQLQAATNSH